jgi:hypothetical protein
MIVDPIVETKNIDIAKEKKKPMSWIHTSKLIGQSSFHGLNLC